MPNTANYSFPTPADTDLVKNGADAIRDLGDAVDTAMNTALGTKKSGLVLLNTTSFSAVASQSVNTVFSSTYTNYYVVVTYTQTLDATLTLRVRVAGVDNSSNNYSHSYYRVKSDGTSGVTGNGNNQTSAYINAASGSSMVSMSEMLISNIGTNVQTKALVKSMHSATDDSNSQYYYGGFMNDALTAYDGFTLIISTGSITGSVSTYGYNV